MKFQLPRAPFIRYLRAITELHSLCIGSYYNGFDWKNAMFNFEENLFFLYNVYQFSMTIKMHVIYVIPT